MSGFVALYHLCVHPVNLPATLLLLLVVLYWLAVIAGALDMAAIDVDLPEADAELSDGLAEHSGFDGFLEYFNIRYVPVSIVASIFALSFWVISVPANHFVHNTASIALGSVVFMVNLIVSCHVAKWFSLPLVPLFRSMRRDVLSKRELTGERVQVVSSTVDGSFGRAEIVEVGAPITLNARTENGEILHKGDEAVILEYKPEQEVCIITKLEI